ncbi:unnamed protein product [Orchesella dallaii]|uniref:Uncharacterized protein n=1 Tax=Orchesella dallaii TaxID=48710 RepID=A0ABP1R060_9HEXA
MHSATVFFALAAFVASASANISQEIVDNDFVGNDIITYPTAGIAHDVHLTLEPWTMILHYGVADKHTGDQKSASEVRNGGVTKGSYSLVQPDGVIRTVNYISTPHGGFQAQVINKGVARHPAVYGHRGHGGHGVGIGAGLGRIGLGGARSVVGGLGLGIGSGLGGVGLF